MTIKEILSAANMTQQQMSDYFGIPKRTIENWCSSSPTSTRKCPEYLLELMEYKLRHEGFTFYHCGDDDEYGTSERISGKITQ